MYSRWFVVVAVLLDDNDLWGERVQWETFAIDAPQARRYFHCDYMDRHPKAGVPLILEVRPA
jgi:hypothetical protein